MTMCSLDRCPSCIILCYGFVLSLTCAFFTSVALDITSVEGEVRFEVKIPHSPGGDGDGGVASHVDRARSDHSGESRMVLRVVRRRNTTVPVDCQYQYPGQEQVNLILSNMKNVLTKVYVRAPSLIQGNTELPITRRRLQATRFKVITKKDTAFFENIYKNMTYGYLTFYNSTTEVVSRGGRDRDPCINQPHIRRMWRDLLDNSLVMLRSAASSTIQEHKRMLNSTEPSTARIENYLARQIMKVKAEQLRLLCKKFQLCFNDLI